MIASFMGLLLLTVISSGYFYKGSRAIVEKRKNGFFTFLLVELLPALSHNVNSGIFNLNRSFEKFISGFHEKLQKLESLVILNNSTLKTQQRVLQSLEQIDPNKIAKINLKMFQELDANISTIKNLHNSTAKLNEWVKQLNGFVEKAESLNDGLKAILTKGNNMQEIADALRNILKDAGRQQEFLNSHFSALESRGTMIDKSVAKVDDVLARSLNDLAEFNGERIDNIKK